MYHINLKRLQENFHELATQFNTGEAGFNRIAFSLEERGALEWLKSKLNAIQVTVKEDAVGNVFGKFGANNLPSISFGSHLDTVRNGGLYDGALGVLAGLECLQTLVENGYKPTKPLELIAFVAEEANPLGGTFGSRALAGMLDESYTDDKLKIANLTWAQCEKAIRSQHEFEAFLELHIEQGFVLEEKRAKIGVATAISGILRVFVRIQGDARHAGTTPMHRRNDALLQAASLVQFVNNVAKKQESNLVATVGEFNVYPNLASVVPGAVECMIEIRGDLWEEIESVEEMISDWCEQHIDASLRRDVVKYPNALDASIQQAITNVCEENDVSYTKMLSGANHDTKSMATLSKAGLIFIPSKDGISHHPDEYSSWEDIEIGTNILLKTLVSLSK
ncbi:M20 family metallo-hydrolase [Lysinibacillus fusiformis]|uniref:M20 family metallo-hydrolase n=1 Tax=Lysinibacillus fusiformis TaxID=28031 RepID=UPI0019686654|nr:M20 family metallo-hydrolase [Lysinibacillus fusiformis]QSB09716.1 M20 family metallo-hydrolase [Lysinibacillus fusiformis]